MNDPDEWVHVPAHGQDFAFCRFGPADSVQRDMIAHGTFYEHAELAFIHAALPLNGARVLDVGANLGNHAIFFHNVCGAHVTLIEPNPDVLDELNLDLVRNGCTRVNTSLLGIGAAAADGNALLSLAAQDRQTHNRGGMRLRPVADGAVKLRRLDAMLDDDFALIKIDVEGMAREVLRGAAGLLRGRDRPALFVEIEAAQEDEFHAWLVANDYVQRASFTMYQGIRNFFCLPAGVPSAAGLPPMKQSKDPTMLPGLPIIEPAALGISEARYQQLRNVFDVQSCVFTCEILPALWALYPNGQHRLNLLDVGPRTGAGTGLLQYLHHPESFSRIKLHTTAIDIDPTYKDYAAVHSPDVEYLVGDIFDESLARTFDVVLCSHTLEHLAEPLPFLRRLQALAKAWVIVACPFDEKDCIPGHVSSLGYDFFESAGVHNLNVYRSLTWHQCMACVAVFKGQAAAE